MNGQADREPEVAKRHFEAATAHAAAGRHREAIEAYSRVIELMPDVEAAHFNLGNSWFALQEFSQAADAYRRAVALKADPPSFNNLGNALGAAGDLEGAVQAFQNALALDEQFAPALNNLGQAYLNLGRPSDALAAFEDALRRHPNNVSAQRLLGDCLVSLDRSEDAIKQYEKALAVAGPRSDILVPLGKTYAQIGQFQRAMDYLIQAQQQEPNNPRIYGELGEVNRERGQVGESLLCFARALQGNPDLPSVHLQLLFTLRYDPTVTAEQFLAEAQRWSQRFLTSTPLPPRSKIEAAGDRQLRIGYLSGGFPSETVRCFLEPVLSHHDPASIESYCYDTKIDVPPRTQGLREVCPNWRNLSSLSDVEAAARVQQDGIDVLVDLAGHSCGRVLNVMALRPAPVQVTWSGASGTTGAPQIDYIVADPVVIPVDQEAHYSERPARMPDCYTCYAPPDRASEAVAQSVRKTPGQVVTLGCFDAMAKLSPQAICCWSQILHAVPNTRLLLKNFALQDEGVRQRVQTLFAAQEVDTSRIHLEGQAHSGTPIEDYSELDIYLSPFPFAGEITTLRALWMGIPVVAKTGSRFSERTSDRFLRMIGQPEWSCGSDQDYVQTVVDLASDAARLGKLRHDIHQRMKTSPLCDPKQFTRHLEHTYRRIWNEFVSAQS